jgi:hypothetical protein
MEEKLLLIVKDRNVTSKNKTRLDMLRYILILSKLF